MDYTVEMDEPAPETVCACGGDCDWRGTFADLEEIGGCSLTPGDQSPAGRCPECDALAYVETDETLRADAAGALFRALVAMVAKYAPPDDGYPGDSPAHKARAAIAAAKGRA